MWLPWPSSRRFRRPRNAGGMGEGPRPTAGPGGPAAPLFRYTSPDEDSARWWDFPFRPGDIVVSTRSKSGTTWVQMICLLLVFGTPELPGRLGALSPWLDWLVRAQGGGLRTPGRPDAPSGHQDPHPARRRAAARRVSPTSSWDATRSTWPSRSIITATTSIAAVWPSSPGSPRGPSDRHARPCTSGSCGFVDWEGDPRQWLDTLPGAMLHLSDAWARRHEPNVVLVHYDDLVDGPRRLHAPDRRPARDSPSTRGAGPLSCTPPPLTPCAPIAARPTPLGVLKDPAAFFRQGRSGEGRALLTGDETAHYRDRVAAMAPADLLAWLHRDGRVSVPIVPDDKDWTWVLGAPAPSAASTRRPCRPSPSPRCCAPTPRAWGRVLQQPGTRLRRRPSDDRWAPLEYACHVRDVCVLYQQRLTLMLREDDPLYPNWDQDATAVEERYLEQDPAAVVGCSCATPRPRWPTRSTACSGRSGSGRAGAATAPPSPSPASAATCSTTRSTTSSTSPGTRAGLGRLSRHARPPQSGSRRAEAGSR